MNVVVVRDRKFLRELLEKEVSIPQDLIGKPCVICIPQEKQIEPGWSSVKNYHVKIAMVSTVHHTENETGRVEVDYEAQINFSSGFIGYFRSTRKKEEKNVISGKFRLPKENSYDRQTLTEGKLILSW